LGGLETILEPGNVEGPETVEAGVPGTVEAEVRVGAEAKGTKKQIYQQCYTNSGSV